MPLPLLALMFQFHAFFELFSSWQRISHPGKGVLQWYDAPYAPYAPYAPFAPMQCKTLALSLNADITT